MDFFSVFIYLIASYAIQALIAPKTKVDKPEAGNLDIPSVDEGDPIPVIFGTEWVDEPKIPWHGDAMTIPIKTKGGKK